MALRWGQGPPSSIHIVRVVGDTHQFYSSGTVQLCSGHVFPRGGVFECLLDFPFDLLGGQAMGRTSMPARAP